jgi:hypothetical protein
LIKQAALFFFLAPLPAGRREPETALFSAATLNNYFFISSAFVIIILT